MAARIQLHGRLTRDAEVIELKNGANMVKFTVATDRPYKTDETDFLDVSCYVPETDETQLEKRVPSLTKGLLVTILDATLEIDKWEDKDGNKRSKPVIRIRNTWGIGYDPKGLRTTQDDPDIPF